MLITTRYRLKIHFEHHFEKLQIISHCDTDTQKERENWKRRENRMRKIDFSNTLPPAFACYSRAGYIFYPKIVLKFMLSLAVLNLKIIDDTNKLISILCCFFCARMGFILETIMEKCVSTRRAQKKHKRKIHHYKLLAKRMTAYQ